MRVRKANLISLIKRGEFDHTKKIMPIKRRNLDGDLIKPFKHQVAAFLVGVLLNSCAFLMEQGTGKTLPMIALVGWRYLHNFIKRLLIVCPISVASELELQFKNFADFPYRLEVLVGDTKHRNKVLEEWKDGPGLQIVIVNYEGTWTRLKNGRNGASPQLMKWKPDMIACDESQKIKNGNSTQTKAICKIAKEIIYKLIMTGTPVSQSPLDFFGQYKFLDSCIFGTSFTKHKERYAVMGGYRGYQVIGYKNENELARKAHSISYRASKADCLDLPKVTQSILSVELEPEAKKIYKGFYKESIIELKGQVITAPLIITRDMKLAQIAGGYLKYLDKNDKFKYMQISKAKLNATLEKTSSLVEAGSKVVIFAKFTAEIMGLVDGLKKLKIKTSSLHGKTKAKERKTIIADFQNPKSKTKVIVVQIATGGVGITLTQADTEIFYSRDFSNIAYEQAKARVDRIGQKKKVTIIHVVAKGTIDTKVARALIKKQDVSKMLVDEYYNKYIGGKKMKRFKQEPMEIVYPIRKIILRIPEGQLEIDTKSSGTSNLVVEADATREDLESLLIQMEKELGVTPNDKLNLWDDKKDDPKTSKSNKRNKTHEKPNKNQLEPKKSREKIELVGDVIPLKQLAKSMGADPKKMRQWFRKEGLETKSGKWEWEKDDPQLAEIQKKYPG